MSQDTMHPYDDQPKTEPNPEAEESTGKFGQALGGCVLAIPAGAYAGALVFVLNIFIYIIVLTVDTGLIGGEDGGLMGFILNAGLVIVIAVVASPLLFLVGLFLAVVGGIGGGIIGGITGIIGFITRVILLWLPNGVSMLAVMGVTTAASVIAFHTLAIEQYNLFDEMEWLGTINLIAAGLFGLVIGFAVSLDPVVVALVEEPDEDVDVGQALMAPWRVIGRVTGTALDASDDAVNKYQRSSRRNRTRRTLNDLKDDSDERLRNARTVSEKMEARKFKEDIDKLDRDFKKNN